MVVSAQNEVTEGTLPLHIGIVACSAEGAALCYRTICTEGPALLGGHGHPEISMHTHSLESYVTCLRNGDWPAIAGLMRASAEKLADIGADFLICPDNTIHRALPSIESDSPLPWLHIAAVVAEEAAARGYRKPALTGTRWLVESDIYADKLRDRGLELLRPSETERQEIDRIIMEELVRGDFKPESTAYLQRVTERMMGEGCDAVIMGCTEIPLIFDDTRSPLPTLDSTRLLARAALRMAINGEDAAWRNRQS